MGRPPSRRPIDGPAGDGDARPDADHNGTDGALVLLSGGLDSTVALWWALRQGWNVTALTIHYPARAAIEMEATRAVAAAARTPLVEAALPWLEEPGQGSARGLAGTPRGYIPARNAVFYSVAAHHAERIGAAVLVGGHHAADPQRFPDAAREWFDGLSALLRKGLATRLPLRIEQPILGMGKEGVVRLGRDLGAPLHLSWSCYEDGPHPCGQCPACVERGAAFAAIGVQDPAVAAV